MKRLLLVVIMAILLASAPAYGQSEEVELPLYTVLDESYGILIGRTLVEIEESGVVHNYMTLLNLGRRDCSVVLDYTMFDDSGKSIYTAEIRIKDLRRNIPKSLDYQLKIANARSQGAYVMLDIKEVDDRHPSIGSSGSEPDMGRENSVYLSMCVPMDRENNIYVSCAYIKTKGPVLGKSGMCRIKNDALVWVWPRSRPMTISFMVDLYTRDLSRPVWSYPVVKSFWEREGWSQWLEQLEECPAASYQCGILRIGTIAK